MYEQILFTYILTYKSIFVKERSDFSYSWIFNHFDSIGFSYVLDNLANSCIFNSKEVFSFAFVYIPRPYTSEKKRIIVPEESGRINYS